MKIFEKRPVFFIAIAAIFFAVLMVVFHDFVGSYPDAHGNGQLMYNSDQLRGIGTRILRAENVVVTEWDDSRLGGVPTVDAQFADVYHPLVWTQFLMNPVWAVGFKFILTIWIAFMCAFALGWHLTGSKWWGALLGFLYAFAPEYFTYIYGGHDGKMMVFAIAPLAILSIRKIVRNGSLPYMGALAISIAWMILSPHVQLTYLFLWGAGLYTLYEVAFHCDGLASKGKRLGLAAVALALGLSLSAFQLVSTFQYTTSQSVRGDSEHTSIGHAASWSLHQEEMAQMLLPGFVGVDVYEQDPKTGELKGSSFLNYSPEDLRAIQQEAAPEYERQIMAQFMSDPRYSQYPEDMLRENARRIAQQQAASASPYYWGHNMFKLDHNYAGALLTFLGFLCLFLPGKRRYAAFWGLGAVVALSYGMGAHSPLFNLWYKILPGIKNFRAAGMALFWLPLLLVMMAGPVLSALSGVRSRYDELKDRSVEDNSRALFHGMVMFVILLVLVLVARFFWTSFIGGLGLVTMIAYALVCLGVMSLDDQKKEFSFGNFAAAYKSLLPGTHRGVQVAILAGFTFIGLLMASGTELPAGSDSFPLKEGIMLATAGKVVPSFVMVLVVVLTAWFVLKSKMNAVARMIILAVVAGIELFFIDGAFVKNVPANSFLQPDNRLVAQFKGMYKTDSLNTPRMLSLVGGPLGPNAFPQYNLRNANGDHDNELATSRRFRGERNANYLMNKGNPEAAHPFLDLMNVSLVVEPEGAWLNPTAMGEAYLYGEAVVVPEDSVAILTLKREGAVREPADSFEEPAVESVVDSSAVSDSSATADSAAVAAAPVPETKPAFADEEGKFFYREKVMLSEKPTDEFKGSVAASGPIQGTVRLVERPKMDTQVFEVKGADRPGFMVVAGNYHPYWKAYINGNEAKVYKAFGNLRAVEIPKGDSQVRMEYRSVPFHRFVPVAAASGVVVLLLLAVPLVRRKK